MAGPSLNSVFEHVNRHGPHVIERTTCPHCQYMEFHIHPFCESLACIKCGKRIASAVPMYKVEGGWEENTKKELPAAREKEPEGHVLTIKVYASKKGLKIRPKFKREISLKAALSVLGGVASGLAEFGQQQGQAKGLTEEQVTSLMFGAKDHG